MGVTFKNTPPGKATIVKQVTSGETVVSETQADEPVAMPQQAGPTVHWGDGAAGVTELQSYEPPKFAEVGFAAGFTKNLGNYSSARVDITLKLPCEPTEIDEAYEFAENWVSQRLQKQHEDF
jgi:hypothetical protein